jgi:putative transposase
MRTGPPAPSSFQSTENVQLIETDDGTRNWDHLNLIFPVYFDLMRQFSCISPEGERDSYLHLTRPPQIGPGCGNGFQTDFEEEAGMPKKRYRPEEIIGKLREADVLLSQGKKVVDVIKALGITDVTYYRWRQEFGGMSVSQAKRLKELEKENERLRKAVSDLTLDKMILKEAAKGNF